MGYGPISYKKPAVFLGFNQALRQQLIVRSHHRTGAHTLLLCALPHRGQSRAGSQQAGLDTFAQARCELIGQGA